MRLQPPSVWQTPGFSLFIPRPIDLARSSGYCPRRLGGQTGLDGPSASVSVQSSPTGALPLPPAYSTLVVGPLTHSCPVNSLVYECSGRFSLLFSFCRPDFELCHVPLVRWILASMLRKLAATSPQSCRMTLSELLKALQRPPSHWQIYDSRLRIEGVNQSACV